MPDNERETARMISERREEILAAWVEAQLAGKAVRLDLMSRQEIETQSRELLDALAAVLEAGDVDDVTAQVFRPVVSLLEELSVRRTQLGFSPSETATYVFSLKETIFAFLREEFADRPGELSQEVLRLSRLLDALGLVTFEAYTHGRQAVIERQQQELIELSTPVIRTWRGVLAVPLIGTLDSARTQVVMESLLQTIVSTGSQVAILDISGVPAVDTLVAQHLLKTVSAARLMGAECIISGIRPEIAQTMVGLGVDLRVKTKASLADALADAFRMIGLRVVPIDEDGGRRGTPWTESRY